MPRIAFPQDWPAVADRLCLWFPHFDSAALRRFRGDRAKLVTYLAESHDLTEAEAAEQLEMWFETAGLAARPGARAA